MILQHKRPPHYSSLYITAVTVVTKHNKKYKVSKQQVSHMRIHSH